MSRRPHIPALDGVRGLAILMVFVYHYGGGAQSKNLLVHLLGSLIKIGWSGVPLFFVLSGFLITGILWDSFHKPGWWKSFYLRRSLRIFPLYYLAIFLVVLAAAFFGDLHQCLHNIWIYALYCQNIPFASKRIGYLGSPLEVVAFWSLAVEEQFYLCWPFLLRCARTLQQAKALCIAIFLIAFLYRIYGSMPGHNIQAAASGTLARAGELAVGAWLALKLRGAPGEWEHFQRWIPTASIVSLAGFAAVTIYSGEPQTSHRAVLTFGLCFIAIFYGCLICMAIKKDSLAERVFSFKPLRWIGTISYSLYVWHEVLGAPISRLSFALTSRLDRNTQLGIRFVVAAVICVAFSYLSYRYFETPFLRMKDRLPGSRPVVPLSETHTAV